MALEDPFFVVKDEVLKALLKTRDLYETWRLSVEGEGREFRSVEEQDWAATELRNSLRSIEWDLEDLEDTIQIVEKNPSKFRIDSVELSSRKYFIQQTRDEVNDMKARAQSPPTNTNGKFTDVSISMEPSSTVSPSPSMSFVSNRANGGGGITDALRLAPSGANSTKYSRLSSEADSPVRSSGTGALLQQQQRQQEQLLQYQDRQLGVMSESVGNLRNVSTAIGRELDEQAVMLDEFGAEIENAESKLDATMRKMAKVLHMSNDRRQWMAIGALSSAIFVIIVMIFALDSTLPVVSTHSTL